jgi:hypothetical protein
MLSFVLISEKGAEAQKGVLEEIRMVEEGAKIRAELVADAKRIKVSILHLLFFFFFFAVTPQQMYMIAFDRLSVKQVATT